jgi:hypothetical protein
MREKVGTGFSQKALRQQRHIEQDAIPVYCLPLSSGGGPLR